MAIDVELGAYDQIAYIDHNGDPADIYAISGEMTFTGIDHYEFSLMYSQMLKHGSMPYPNHKVHMDAFGYVLWEHIM